MATRVSFELPTKVRFGRGVTSELGSFLTARGVRRLLVLSDAGLAASGVLNRTLAPIRASQVHVGLFTDIPTNPALDTVEAAMALAADFRPGAVLSIGGGSPIDVAKAVALLLGNGGPLSRYQWDGVAPTRPALLHIAVPTTAGTGSEVTRTTVIVDRGTKKGIVSDVLYPVVSFIDPELMVSLPPPMTAATGADALTHAIEAYVGKGANAFTSALAARAVRLIGASLRPAFRDGSDLRARSDLAMGSTLAGIAMDQGGLGIVHSLSGPLSAWHGVHHGLSNAIFLAESIRFNAPVAAGAYAELAGCLGLEARDDSAAAEALANACAELMGELGVGALPASYQFTPAEIDRMAEAAAAMFLARNNPRPVTAADCRSIYRKVLRVKG